MRKAVLILAALLPVTAQAWCFDYAAREYGLKDADLLRAIAHVESRNRPWAINLNRTSRGVSEDVGVMQINSQHFSLLEKAGITRKMLFEPCLNIRTGAWILSEAVAKHGYTWRAVKAYNGINNPHYAPLVWQAYRDKAWLKASSKSDAKAKPKARKGKTS